MILPLWLFWWMRGHLSEGRAHCERLLALPGGNAQPLTRAQALTGAGIVLRWLGAEEQARACQEVALSIYWDLPPTQQRGACWSLLCLGDLARGAGDHAGAADRYEEALRLARERDDRYMISFGLITTGGVAAEHGDLVRASEAFGACVPLCRSIGNVLGLAMSLGNLGLVLQLRGDFTQARALDEESVVLMRQLGHQRMVAKSLIHLAWMDLREGQLLRARGRFAEALALSRDIGDVADVADAEIGLGETARRARELDEAERQFRVAIATVLPLPDSAVHDGIASTLPLLAAVARDRGRLERAARLSGAAAGIRERSNLLLAGLDKDEVDAIVASIAAALDAATFDAAWSAGRALSVDDAVAEALDA